VSPRASHNAISTLCRFLGEELIAQSRGCTAGGTIGQDIFNPITRACAVGGAGRKLTRARIPKISLEWPHAMPADGRWYQARGSCGGRPTPRRPARGRDATWPTGDRVSCRGGSRSTSSTIIRSSRPQNSFGSQQLIYTREAPKAESRLGPHRSVRMEGLGSPPTLAYRRERGDPGLQEVRQGSAPCQSGLGYQGLCLRRERLPAIRLPHRDPQRPLLSRRPVVSTLTSLASLFVRSALIQRSKFAGTGFEG
jgi:hypothetical protein